MRTNVAKDGVVFPLFWKCRIWSISTAVQSSSSCNSPGDLLTCTILVKCGILQPGSACPSHIPFIGKEWEKPLHVQRLAHAGFRVLVWENFIWNLGECRLINVLVCRVRENLAERPCFPHTQWRSKAVLLQQSIPADIRERLNSSSRMKKKFKFKSAFLFPLQRWRKPLFSKFCIFLSSTDHSAGSARHQRRSLSDFLVRR